MSLLPKALQHAFCHWLSLNTRLRENMLQEALLARTLHALEHKALVPRRHQSPHLCHDMGMVSQHSLPNTLYQAVLINSGQYSFLRSR